MLSQSKDPRVRQYTIEAMQLLVLEIFAYKKQFISPNLDDDFPDDSIANEDEIVFQRETDEQWQNDQWQYTILLPFSELLKTTNVQDKILILKSLEKIIQQGG